MAARTSVGMERDFGTKSNKIARPERSLPASGSLISYGSVARTKRARSKLLNDYHVSVAPRSVLNGDLGGGICEKIGSVNKNEESSRETARHI